MRNLLAMVAAATLALSATAGLAQTDTDTQTSVIGPDTSFEGIDTNRDGAVSWVEFSLIFDDYNESQFNLADLNDDGLLDEDEFSTIVAATGSIRRPSGEIVAPDDETDLMESLSSTN